MSERVEDISFIEGGKSCVPFRGIEGMLGMRVLFVYFLTEDERTRGVKLSEGR